MEGAWLKAGLRELLSTENVTKWLGAAMREARDKPQLLPGPGFPYLPHGGVGLAHCCGLSSPQCGLSAKLPAPPRGQHQPPPAVPAETRSAEVLGKARAKAGEKMEGEAGSWR